MEEWEFLERLGDVQKAILEKNLAAKKRLEKIREQKLIKLGGSNNE